jgi:uncharacterized protein (DUF58 family)
VTQPPDPGPAAGEAEAVPLPRGAAPGRTGPLLSPEFLAGIKPLQLRARVLADALFAGGHRSRRFGSSSEFAEHKLYAPGDDLRRLDWRVMGRLDKSYVRRTEDETRVDIALVVDTSNSMAYRGGARGKESWSKLELATTLAAAIATVALRQQDAPGISLFSSTEHLWLPPRGRKDALAQLTDHLAAARPDGKTDLQAVLAALNTRLTKKTVVVVLSDLIDTPPDALLALGVLRKRGSDCLVLQTLHDDELGFTFDGVVRFEDLEGDRVVQVDAPLVRNAYLQELARFLGTVRDACTRVDARYVLARTDISPVLTLGEVL